MSGRQGETPNFNSVIPEICHSFDPLLWNMNLTAQTDSKIYLDNNC